MKKCNCPELPCQACKGRLYPTKEEADNKTKDLLDRAEKIAKEKYPGVRDSGLALAAIIEIAKILQMEE